MKTFNRLAACALIVPLTLGAASVYAQERTPERAQEQREAHKPADERHGADATQRKGKQQAGTTGQADKMAGKGHSAAGKAELTRAPANAFHTDWLIGKEVKTQVGDDKIGSIRDLLVGEDGRIVAVIVGVGGLLGIGERDVAIPWNAIQHTRDSDGDSQFTTSMAKAALENLPEYDRDATGARDRDASSSRDRATQRQDKKQAGATGQADKMAAKGQQVAGKAQLTRAPVNAFHSDRLMGKDVKAQASDDTVGTVRDLLVDEDGKIVAVIVGVGGLLGMGERDVAIPWNAIQHTRDADGDSRFTTNMTKAALENAPEYDRDATGARSQDVKRQGMQELTRAPANAFHTDWLMGNDIESQVGADNIGTVRDLLVGEDGRIVAVIVGVGGLLGMGEREVAIPWDTIQHTRDADGDSRFTTSMTKAALENAPEYDRDASESRNPGATGTRQEAKGTRDRDATKPRN